MRQDVQVVQTMVDTMVGIPQFSYPARQNFAPRPTEEFAHIRMIEEYQVGIPNQRIKSQTDLETVFLTVSPAKLRFRHSNNARLDFRSNEGNHVIIRLRLHPMYTSLE